MTNNANAIPGKVGEIFHELAMEPAGIFNDPKAREFYHRVHSSVLTYGDEAVYKPADHEKEDKIPVRQGE